MEGYIYIEYYGTIRLIFNKKEEIIRINKSIKLEDFIKKIDQIHHKDLISRSSKLNFYYYEEKGDKFLILKYPKDKESIIKIGSKIKIFNTLTLG
ncbi:MAG: hypothetical protein SCJ93_13110 [Bacillota bacterium]|nr:hypothetical protein [Bacillota bacterium]